MLHRILLRFTCNITYFTPAPCEKLKMQLFRKMRYAKCEKLLFSLRFPGKVRARYLEYGHGGGLRRREFELVRRGGLRTLRGT